MKIVKLTLFLSIVGAIAGGVLSFVNEMTAPIIEKRALEAELANLEILFPDAEFTELELEDGSSHVQSAYVASGEGYAFKVEVLGYNTSTPIVFMLGIDMDSNIVGYQVLSQQETSLIGSRIAEDEFVSTIVGSTVNDSVDILSGATVSSTAVALGITDAKELYGEISGTEVSVEPSTEPEKVTVVSSNEGVYVVDSFGLYGVNTFEITITDGVVASVVMLEANDTPDYVGLVDETYLSGFVGLNSTEGFDVVSGATGSSNSAIQAVQAALDAAKQ